jgi:hypothetical protein
MSETYKLVAPVEQGEQLIESLIIERSDGVEITYSNVVRRESRPTVDYIYFAERRVEK